MKIKAFSSVADENKAIFVGQHGRRKYVHVFVGLSSRRKYFQYFRRLCWPIKTCQVFLSASQADENHCRIFIGCEPTKILERVQYFRRPPL
jgi:hypothetical protein